MAQNRAEHATVGNWQLEIAYLVPDDRWEWRVVRITGNEVISRSPIVAHGSAASLPEAREAAMKSANIAVYSQVIWKQITTPDPYPGTTFEKALEALRERFPGGDIEYRPAGGDTFISLPLDGGGTFRAGLTWQQAKYLAFSTLTGDDLKNGRLPKDWPPA